MWKIPLDQWAQLEQDLDGPDAVRVAEACFRDGWEDEHRIDFFRHGGRLIRRHYDGHSTRTRYHIVDGEDLELFNIYFPEKGQA